jgi:hypothetical protein
LEGILLMHDLFQRSLPEGSLEKWQPGVSSGHRSIEAANRCFTPIKFCSDSAPIPFHSLVDPKGVLAALNDRDHVHSSDNEVRYFERVAVDGGVFR